MVIVNLSNDELDEIANDTPDFEAFLEELIKNPNFELEVVEAVGVRVKYHDESES